MTDLADRKNSVTRNDFLPAGDGGVFVWQVFDPGAMASPVATLPMIGRRERDQMLAATLDLEDMWAGAVSKAVTKIAVRGYEVSDSDDSARRTDKAKSLVMNLDGPSDYRAGMAKLVQDYLLTDNGWFMEIEREGKSPTSRPRALYHLDSFRCYRTGNLDYPVLYMDHAGELHKLRADQVLFGSDLPSPRSTLWGRGRCAASRAFATIVKLSAVETYFREKITGSRALALHFIAGVGPKQIQDAIETSSAENARRGNVAYKGAVMVPIMGGSEGAGVSIATVDLASVPDGFDVEQERKDAYLRYANALGVPVQDIQPLSGQGLGTGAQTIVLDEAAEGQGLTFFVKDFEDKVNNLVMPKTTIFQLKQNDVRDQKAKADLNTAKAAMIVSLMGQGGQGGVISQQMALQMAVDEGLVPREFLPADVTPEGVLTDSGDQSKPAGLPQLAPYAGQMPAPQAPQPMAAKATKEDEWEQAVQWAEDASKPDHT